MQHTGIARIQLESTRLWSLWRLLLDGRVLVVESHCAGGRCYALIEPQAVGRPLRGPGVQILERFFAGESQKSVALDLKLSIPTASAQSAHVLRAMAPKTSRSASEPTQLVSRAPMILVMAAMAARGVGLEDARLEHERQDGAWLISTAVPGTTFQGRLSASEWQVVRLAIEGETYAAIASSRNSSTRTVANQLAAAFRKLRLSGRGMLRAQAVRESALCPESCGERIPSAPVGAWAAPGVRAKGQLDGWL